jgi:hypothetical protein
MKVEERAIYFLHHSNFLPNYVRLEAHHIILLKIGGFIMYAWPISFSVDQHDKDYDLVSHRKRPSIINF